MNAIYRTVAELPRRLRELVSAMLLRLRAWMDAVRAEPALLWHTPMLRVAIIVLVGAGVLALINRLATGLTPGLDRSAFETPTRLATLYVACTNPDCRVSFTTHQPMNFKAWPLVCPHCGQKSVYRATLCPNCGRWYASAPGTPAALIRSESVIPTMRKIRGPRSGIARIRSSLVSSGTVGAFSIAGAAAPPVSLAVHDT